MPSPAHHRPEPYRAFPNSFKRRLLAGETLIGCWCSLANPITTEVLGVAGFDWLLLDGEHSPNDVTTSWGRPSVTTYVERGICEIIP